jgi:hypothetical protein
LAGRVVTRAGTTYEENIADRKAGPGMNSIRLVSLYEIGTRCFVAASLIQWTAAMGW